MYNLKVIRETMVVPVGWNEYGEIAEDRLFKTYQPTYEQQYLFFVYIKIACITKGIMFYICHPMILSAM